MFQKYRAGNKSNIYIKGSCSMNVPFSRSQGRIRKRAEILWGGFWVFCDFFILFYLSIF